MSPRPLTFQQGEVTRLAKAVIAAGLPVGRVEVQIGRDGSRKVIAVIKGEGYAETPVEPNEEIVL